MSTILDPPAAAGQLLLGGGIVVGLVLWLLGRKLARPACAIGGLLAGSCVAAFFVRDWSDVTGQLATVIGSGVAGCVVAFLLFRIWMGMTCAIVLALAVPAGMLMTTDAPDVETPAAAQLMIQTTPSGPTDGESDAAEDGETELSDLRQQLESLYEEQRQAMEAWWKSLSAEARRMAIVSAGIGTIIGLLGGLIFPYMTSSIMSAFLGAMLVIGCSLTFIRIHATTEPSWLPDDPQTFLAAASLITAVGVTLQWTLFRRKAD